jgi:hypothetical protein
MTITNTAKLGIPVDTLGEGLISTQPNSWKRVDTAAGVMTCTSTAPISNSDLYDGAIVAEKDTGISWKCKSDGSGGFTKLYLNYPWWVIKYFSNGLANTGSNADTGFDTYYQGVNAPDTDVTVPGLNGIRVPIKALYSFTLYARWNGNGAGVRRVSPRINAAVVLTDWEQVDQGYGSQVIGQICKFQRVMNPGDFIMGQYWQNCGAQLGYGTSCWVTLIRPVR